MTLADSRDDDIYRVGVSQSVWITDYDGVTAELEATFVDSTIRNFDRENFSGVLSYTRRF